MADDSLEPESWHKMYGKDVPNVVVVGLGRRADRLPQRDLVVRSSESESESESDESDSDSEADRSPAGKRQRQQGGADSTSVRGRRPQHGAGGGPKEGCLDDDAQLAWGLETDDAQRQPRSDARARRPEKLLPRMLNTRGVSCFK